jgi:hypothetical protein
MTKTGKGKRAAVGGEARIIPEKPDAQLPGQDDGPATYQQALDEALAETFPASDPISPSAAGIVGPVSSPADRVDWPLSQSDEVKLRHTTGRKKK